MRVFLPALFLAASFGGPHGGCDCGHMGAAAHGGSVGHASFSNAHFPISSSVSHASSGGAPGLAPRAAPTDHPHLGATLANGLRHALDAGARALEAALGLAVAEPPGSDPPDDAPACRTAADCGEGELGHGTVCDHWSQEPRVVGLCREACRTDADCPAPMECQWGLDPDGPNRGGCVE